MYKGSLENGENRETFSSNGASKPLLCRPKKGQRKSQEREEVALTGNRGRLSFKRNFHFGVVIKKQTKYKEYKNNI